MRYLWCLLAVATSAAWAEPTSFKCAYSNFADEEGLHPVEGKFVLTFLIDDETSKAYLIGNNGSSEVQVVSITPGGFSLVEITAVGNVMTTTIAESGRSVHSRNSVLYGELIPSQYYGECN